MKTSSHSDIYQLVTNLISEKLDQGVIPWKQPWNTFGPAVNYLSKKSSRGFNQLILNGLHVKLFYLTFHQAVSLGVRIKKSAKSIPVTYWNFVYRDKNTNRKLTSEEAKPFPIELMDKFAFLKYYRVFNIEDILQVDFDIPEINQNQHNFSIEKCDAVISEMKDPPKIRHQENQAYYNPVNDFINGSLQVIKYFL